VLIISRETEEITKFCELIRRKEKIHWNVVHPMHYLEFRDKKTPLIAYNRIKSMFSNQYVIIDNYFKDFENIKQLIFNLNIIGLSITHIITTCENFNSCLFKNIFFLNKFEYTQTLQLYLSDTHTILNQNNKNINMIMYNVFNSSIAYSKVHDKIKKILTQTTEGYLLIKFVSCYFFDVKNKKLYKFPLDKNNNKMNRFLLDDILYIDKNYESNLNKLDFIVKKRYTKNKTVEVKRILMFETSKFRII